MPARERAPGGDPGLESRDATKHLDRDQRTADRLDEQARWATSCRRRSVYLQVRASWLATVTGRAA